MIRTITYTLLQSVEELPQNPQRGDRLKTSRSWYYILHSRRIKTRDGKRKFKLYVLKFPLDEKLRMRLLRSSLRHGGSYIFGLKWDSRAPKKKRSFEDLMRCGNNRNSI